VIEGGGKRRLFAVCNFVKQRLLSPVHDWAFKVLKVIKADGTFDQERPLRRLRARGGLLDVYSFDLKSATDRWPLGVIYTTVESLFGPTFASSVVNSSLGLNTFLVGPPQPRKFHELSFRVGQALGFKGSWSLFALSHHFVVWMAAQRADPSRSSPFWNYALLGDDIVIADKEVAHHYKEILDQLDVKISMPKSIVSRTGCCEFAKRFWVKSMKVDLSPISLRSLTGCRSIRGLVQVAGKYGVTSPSVLQRLGGAGYRVRSRLMTKQSKRWERLKVVASKPAQVTTFRNVAWKGETPKPISKGEDGGLSPKGIET